MYTKRSSSRCSNVGLQGILRTHLGWSQLICSRSSNLRSNYKQKKTTWMLKKTMMKTKSQRINSRNLNFIWDFTKEKMHFAVQSMLLLRKLKETKESLFSFLQLMESFKALLYFFIGKFIFKSLKISIHGVSSQHWKQCYNLYL